MVGSHALVVGRHEVTQPLVPLVRAGGLEPILVTSLAGEEALRALGIASLVIDVRAPLEREQADEFDSGDKPYLLLDPETDLGLPLLRRLLTGLLEQQELRARVRRLAETDAVTGLLNRATFLMALEERSAQRNVALVIMDLARFSVVVKSFGFSTGDAILRAAAERVRETCGDDARIGRLGTDQLGIILAAETPTEVATLVSTLEEALAIPYFLEGRELYVQSAIGWAHHHAGQAIAERFLEESGRALQAAKKQGHSAAVAFRPSLPVDRDTGLEVDGGLRAAASRGDFFLMHQPKVRLADGQLEGFESLLRWRKPDGRVISPAQFIPALETTGLIANVTRGSIGTACRLARQASEWFGRPLRAAVNISPTQLGRPGFVEWVVQALEVHGVEPSLLEIEITESALISNEKAAREQLNALNALGIRLALDDFGTGFSSLSYVHSLPFHTIKMDRSFIAALTDGPKARAVAASVLGLASTLGMDVVAEGVETETQRRILLDLGYEQAQGYLFSKPLRAEDLQQFSVRTLAAA